MKKLYILLGILLGIAFFVWYFIWFFSGGFLPNPPEPEIEYGEFPFKLVYEIDGETKEVEDTLICEYVGFSINATRGKYRNWKSYLASGNTRITLLKNDEIEIFYTPDINQHSAPVYMGDTEIYDSTNVKFPDAWLTTDFDNKQVKKKTVYAEELWETYKIKLISWEIAPPIKNSFK